MAARVVLGFALLFVLNGCAVAASAPHAAAPATFPVLAERVASLYADQVTIPVNQLGPTTSLALQTPRGLSVSALRITFADGSDMVVTGPVRRRIDLPGPPRRLRQLEVTYASQAPPDTFATIRVHDMTVARERSRPTATHPVARR